MNSLHNFTIFSFKQIFTLFLFVLLNINIAFSDSFKTLAKVNGNIVTTYDLENYKKTIELHTKEKINKNSQILDSYIDFLIRSDAIKTEGIEFNQEEFEIFKEDIESNKDFLKNKNKLKIDASFYNNFLKTEFLWLKLIEEKIKPNVGVTTSEANESLEYLSSDSVTVKYNISEITINKIGDKDSKQIVNKIYDEVSKKNNFEIIAEKLSQSSTKNKSGLLGWVDQNEINKKIFDEIKNLSVGKISKPIYFGDTDSGYYMIIKLNDKKSERNIRPEDLNKAQYFIYMRKLDIELKNYINKINSNSFIEIYK